MIEPWVAGAVSGVALAIALGIHTGLRGWLPEDVPGGSRKQHARSVPMAGFVCALICVALLIGSQRGWLAAACAVAAIIGTIDDASKEAADGVAWWIKGAALALAAALATIGLAQHPGFDAASWPLWIAIAAWIFVVTNATNFMDNTDGVAAALGTIALAWVGGIAAPLAAVWLAFTPFNWPVARLFLGDGGALPLGLLAGSFAVEGGGGSVLATIAPVAVSCVDFVQVVVARVWLGYAPWVADRRHLTHIAQNLGIPTVLVAPIFVGLALLAAWLLDRITASA